MKSYWVIREAFCVGLGLNRRTFHLNELFCAVLVLLDVIVQHVASLSSSDYCCYLDVSSSVCVCVRDYLPSVSVCRLVYNLLEGETGTHVLNWLTAAGEPRLLSTDNTRRCNICGVYFCHLVVIFSLCPAQRPLWDFNHPAAAAAAARIKCPAFPLWVWHFVPIFMFICVFSSFPSPP